MRFGSVCSGIEAASVAWRPLGWKGAFVSEIDKAASAVLAHHYPETPNLGDMTKWNTWPDATLDVLIGGTPCQSFSLAGLRRGLDDPRGALMLVYGAIARRYRPRWLVWENVPGALSADEGRAFGTLVGMLAELGYGFAYRVLDAQYFGLAQRRERVFVVGYLGDWRPPAAVLLERAGLSNDPRPRRVFAAGEIAQGGGGGSREAVAFKTSHYTRGKDGAPSVIFPPLSADADRGDQEAVLLCPGDAIAFALRGREGGVAPEIHGDGTTVGALRSASGGSSRDYLAIGDVVRRITPREAERLQGFEDDYTLVPFAGGMMSDSQRYKQLGNTIAVPVLDWLGRRIDRVEAEMARMRVAA
jgi:DNA (cytosine-5)-methyltransferase 1